MKTLILLTLAIGFTSVNSFAGDASALRWSCTADQGTEVTMVQVENGTATVTGYSKIAEHMPMIIGGPFKNLETFGGGDFFGVKTQDGNFSLIANTMTFKSTFGGKVTVDNVHCKNF